MLDDLLAQALVAILSAHVGHKQRISREDLRRYAAAAIERPVSDREMRKAIEELRATSQGATICAACGHAGAHGSGGYFLAGSKEELDQHIRQDEHRALKTLKRLHRQRLAAGMKLAGVSMPALEGI